MCKYYQHPTKNVRNDISMKNLKSIILYMNYSKNVKGFENPIVILFQNRFKQKVHSISFSTKVHIQNLGNAFKSNFMT